MSHEYGRSIDHGQRRPWRWRLLGRRTGPYRQEHSRWRDSSPDTVLRGSAWLAVMLLGLYALFQGVLHLARPARVAGQERPGAGISLPSPHSSPPRAAVTEPGPRPERSLPATVAARPPRGALDVRKFGARGDGERDDRPAILAALDSLKVGGTLYFPPGQYRVGDKVIVRKGGIRLLGAGPKSRILMPPAEDCFQVGEGRVIAPVTVERLTFVGLRLWDMKLNHFKALLLFGARDCRIRECVFEGAGAGVMDADPTRGTRIERCRFVDWGTLGAFLNAGAHVSDCRFEQNDPDLKGEKTSHGLYIHSGASDVTVEHCTITGARKYGIQVYGEQEGTEIVRVHIRDNVFRRNAGHLIVGGTPQGPAIRDVRIENNRFSDSDGTSVYFKKGREILFRGNRIVNAGGNAIQVGVWAPYEPGMRLKGVRIEENQIEWTVGAKRTGGQYGIWALGQRGHLEDLTLFNNHISGFADNQYPGGGIALEQVTGAQVRENRITMPDFAGRQGSCAGIWVKASSNVSLAENEIRIPENPNAVGLQLDSGNRSLTNDRNTTRRVRGSNQ